MTTIAIPNVSEGRDASLLARMQEAMAAAGARVLDVHSDEHHGRTVFTVTAPPPSLVDAMVALAREASALDLGEHHGVHPRVGGLDVCPFVPHEEAMGVAISASKEAGRRIAAEIGYPVYLYGRASDRGLELPQIRRGGLASLTARATSDLPPDLGPHEIDPHRGVVCVGARAVLIAFNVWLRGPIGVADKIATLVRNRGLGVRALGFEIEHGRSSQVSMNLTAPELFGIDDAFGAVKDLADNERIEVSGTEIVGLVPRRFMPNPDAQAARLLIAPGRSLEDVLSY